QDMAEWAGVSVGTVHNCYKRVMVAILHHHDEVIHLNPEEPQDRREKDRAKRYVEERTCPQWKGGFLCVDGTPFNLFQKPGLHGEGFFDRKSNYSLSNQIIIFPHNLCIVDYVIGVPGSLHDASAFQHTQCAWPPERFFGENEWLWTDSAYGCQKWCIVPFKRPASGQLTRVQKTFNYHLSKVCNSSFYIFSPYSSVMARYVFDLNIFMVPLKGASNPCESFKSKYRLQKTWSIVMHGCEVVWFSIT
ncbi:hypothetical protein M404DRAFT_134955, partial [Pisolithus tinctorius Marx 270]